MDGDVCRASTSAARLRRTGVLLARQPESPEEVQGALQRVRGVDLILCGHAPEPLVMTMALPGDRSALVIRSPDDGAGYVLLTHRPRQRPARFGFSEWEITIGAAEVPAS